MLGAIVNSAIEFDRSRKRAHARIGTALDQKLRVLRPQTQPLKLGLRYCIKSDTSWAPCIRTTHFWPETDTFVKLKASISLGFLLRNPVRMEKQTLKSDRVAIFIAGHGPAHLKDCNPTGLLRGRESGTWR